MSKHSKYRKEIIELRNSGKKYKEISLLLNLKLSVVSYYIGYKHNKSKIKTKKNRTNSKIRNKEFVKDYLLNHPCVDCGNSDIRVLDFDHVKGNKVNNISNLVRNATSLNNIISEIEKCEIRCANCHRIVTYERRKINQLKKSNTL